MSYLNEVLSHIKEINLENSTEEVARISSKIDEQKRSIHKNIDQCYGKFKVFPTKNKKLLDSSTQLSSQVELLEHDVQESILTEVNRKKDEFTDLLEKITRSTIALEITTTLIKVHEAFTSITELCSKSMFLKATEELSRLEDYLANIPEDEVTNALVSFRSRIVQEKASLSVEVLKMYHEHVSHEQTVKQTKVGDFQVNSLKIKKDDQKLSEILSRLKYLGDLNNELDALTDFLWQELCVLVFLDNSAMVKVEDKSDSLVLIVTARKPAQNSPYNRNILTKLLEVFTFIHTNLHYTVNGLKIISVISSKMSSNLCGELLKYFDSKQVTDVDVKAFHSKLVELEMLDGDSNPILDYIESIDEAFIKKKCEEHLNYAVALMRKDLHDLVIVEDTSEESSFSVSHSTIEIIDFLGKLLEEAADEKSELYAARIISVVQTIPSKYGKIVSLHHKQLIETIPQQVALFKNNCTHIAYHLALLNNSYTDRFPRAASPSSNVFTTEGQELKAMANEIFSKYVQNQVKQMEATLEDGELTTSQIAAGKLNPNTDKCIRQCMRQYELLKTVWIKVLSNSEYNETLGSLFNYFCAKLIEIVVKAEDISSKNAEQLVEIYKVVLLRGPKLFNHPQEITLHVLSWQKLNDLVFILGASLINISEKWADGKGTLTLTFKPEELRGLIKALFQNTDYRAAVLSSIR